MGKKQKKHTLQFGEAYVFFACFCVIPWKCVEFSGNFEIPTKPIIPQQRDFRELQRSCRWWARWWDYTTTRDFRELQPWQHGGTASHHYTTTRDFRELQLMLSLAYVAAYYTTTRDFRELQRDLTVSLTSENYTTTRNFRELQPASVYFAPFFHYTTTKNFRQPQLCQLSPNGGTEMFRKSSISKTPYGKIYYAVIRERCPAYWTTFSKSCENPKRQAQIFSAGSSLSIIACLRSNHSQKPWCPLFRVVRRFAAPLQHG